MDVKKLNTTSLAYIGDAVYEVYVRSHVMEKDAAHTDALHRRAVAFVRADGQAQVIKRLMREREAAQTDKRVRLWAAAVIWAAAGTCSAKLWMRARARSIVRASVIRQMRVFC
mgnify:CR=1 FL=1